MTLAATSTGHDGVKSAPGARGWYEVVHADTDAHPRHEQLLGERVRRPRPARGFDDSGGPSSVNLIAFGLGVGEGRRWPCPIVRARPSWRMSEPPPDRVLLSVVASLDDTWAGCRHASMA